MKTVKGPDEVTAAGFFVVRSPLLEADATHDGIDGVMSRDFVREALKRASPSLLDALDGKRKSRDDVWPPIVRYLERMMGRSTPFSLMAGYSIGTFDEGPSSVRFVAQSEYLRIIRLDYDCLARIANHLAAQDPRATKWIKRSGVALLPDLVRLTTRLPGQDEVTTIDVARSGAIDAVFAAASSASAFDAIVDALTPHAPNRDAAVAYVDALIGEALLVPANTPRLLADDELHEIDSTAAGVTAAARRVRTTSLGEAIDEEIGELETEIQKASGSCEREDLIFDLVKPTSHASLGDEVLTEIRGLVRILQRIAAPPRDRRVEQFVEQFSRAFEGRELPLVEVIDRRRGLSFEAESLVDPVANEDERALDTWLLGIFEKWLRNPSDEIVLEDHDLPSKVLSPLPEAFAMTFELAEDPCRIWSPRLTGPPGTSLFARAGGFFNDLLTHARDFTSQVAARNPHVDYADVVYPIPKRLAAPCQFAPLQPFEISLATIGGDPEHSIDVNDLLVSVRNGKVRVRSAKSGKTVRVRPTSALEPDRPEVSDICRFLYVVSRDEVGSAWSWRSLEGAARLPRVRYGNHVLSPARWRIGKRHLDDLRGHEKTERSERLQNLRRELSLPRRVRYRDAAGMTLPVDLDNSRSVDAFVDLLKNQEEIVITEGFPVESSLVRGPEGPYHHEIVVPLMGPPVRPTEQDDEKILSIAQTVDREIPGGDVICIYYWGDRDELIRITHALKSSIITPAFERGEISHWFFVPYSDPDPHVRLRLFGRARDLYGSILHGVRETLDPFASQRVLSRVTLETYDRETYRYGGRIGLAHAERFFCISSEIALHLHDSHSFDVDESSAHEAAIAVVRSHRAILEATGLSADALVDVASLAASRYERNADASTSKKSASTIFRSIASAFDDGDEDDLPTPEQRGALASTFRDLRASISSGAVDRSFEELLVDYMHMHTTRLLTTWPEFLHFESTCYHLLIKLLRQELARKK